MNAHSYKVILQEPPVTPVAKTEATVIPTIFMQDIALIEIQVVFLLGFFIDNIARCLV